MWHFYVNLPHYCRGTANDVTMQQVNDSCTIDGTTGKMNCGNLSSVLYLDSVFPLAVDFLGSFWYHFNENLN
jgi:hypothetical protein